MKRKNSWLPTHYVWTGTTNIPQVQIHFNFHHIWEQQSTMIKKTHYWKKDTIFNSVHLLLIHFQAVLLRFQSFKCKCKGISINGTRCYVLLIYFAFPSTLPQRSGPLLTLYPECSTFTHLQRWRQWASSGPASPVLPASQRTPPCGPNWKAKHI